MLDFLKNYLSTLLILIIAYFAYTLSSLNYFFIKDIYILWTSINTLDIYKSIILSYAILLIPFYYKFNFIKSKSRIVITFLLKKCTFNNARFTSIEHQAILSLLVKLFFAPLMILFFASQVWTVLNNLKYSFNDIWLISNNFILFFNNNLFWLVFSILFFIDIIFYLIGYLIEIPKSKHVIKTVDATFLWWFVALICYPPFNTYTTNIIWWYSIDFPVFSNIYVHLALNILILILLVIYASSSLALWFKASNLTNRWIVTTGVYKYIRHPAYIAKNLTWWIWWLPILILNYSISNYKTFFIILFSLLAWSFIYYLRAITEERHLSLDKDYLAYKNKVKYKFIPWVF